MKSAAAALVATVIALSAATPAAATGWGPPFRLAAPASLDVIPSQIAISSAGAAAVGYGVQDEDNPALSTAFMTGRSAAGKISRPRRIAGQQQILDLDYDGTSVALLAGTSPLGLACCSSAETLRSGRGGSFGGGRTLVTGLAGATTGRLVELPGRLLAAIATERGVWVSQSSGGNRFAAAHRLTGSGAQVESLSATSLPHGQSLVAWAAAPNQATGLRTIFISKGSQKRPPRGARAVITAPAGHTVDELAVVSGPSVPTVAWIEGWYDTAGLYHSQAFVADLREIVRPKPLSAPAELASGLSFAADTRGDQALSWKACASTGFCAVRAATRHARGRFSRVQDLAAVDASQTPSVGVSPSGETLLGWIQQGHVLAAAAPAKARRFGPPRLVSPTNFAADFTLAFGPSGWALATWTQGTLSQILVGALYSSP